MPSAASQRCHVPIQARHRGSRRRRRLTWCWWGAPFGAPGNAASPAQVRGQGHAHSKWDWCKWPLYGLFMCTRPSPTRAHTLTGRVHPFAHVRRHMCARAHTRGVRLNGRAQQAPLYRFLCSANCAEAHTRPAKSRGTGSCSPLRPPCRAPPPPPRSCRRASPAPRSSGPGCQSPGACI